MAKFEIKHRLSATVLFSIETESWRLAVEAAVKAGADLAGADLARAYLAGADLARANLAGADLARADLTRANLARADLAGADLAGAYLAGAYLAGADLAGANLARADLARADLAGADLAGAYLAGAYLVRANLAGAKGFNKNVVMPLRILLDQPGPVWAYKLVNKKGEGPFAAGNGYTPINYISDEEFSVKTFEASESVDCGAGISLASLDWCMRNWKPDYRILIMEFFVNEPEGNLCIPTATDGKFRVRTCRRVGEKDLVEIGLVKKEAGATETED